MWGWWLRPSRAAGRALTAACVDASSATPRLRYRSACLSPALYAKSTGVYVFSQHCMLRDCPQLLVQLSPDADTQASPSAATLDVAPPIQPPASAPATPAHAIEDRHESVASSSVPHGRTAPLGMHAFTDTHGHSSATRTSPAPSAPSSAARPTAVSSACNTDDDLFPRPPFSPRPSPSPAPPPPRPATIGTQTGLGLAYARLVAVGGDGPVAVGLHVGDAMTPAITVSDDEPQVSRTATRLFLFLHHCPSSPACTLAPPLYAP